MNKNMAELAERWDKACPGIDSVLKKYSPKFGWTINKWEEDRAARTVSWEDKPAYSISLLLGDEPKPILKVFAATWNDFPTMSGEPLRRVFQLKPRELTTPVRSKQFQAVVDEITGQLSQVAKQYPTLRSYYSPTFEAQGVFVAYVAKVSEFNMPRPGSTC